MKYKGTALVAGAVVVLTSCTSTVADSSVSTGPLSPVTSAPVVAHTPRVSEASAWPAPNQHLTPGAIVPGCTYPRPAAQRKVTPETRFRVLQAYGYHGPTDVAHIELDHRVPFSLCGADDYLCGKAKSCPVAESNLWVEPYDGVKRSAFVANYKDVLEGVIARKVRLGPARGGMSLAEGQAVFLGDWRKGYCKYVDPAPCASR